MIRPIEINLTLICTPDGVFLPHHYEQKQFLFSDKEAFESFIWGIVKQKIEDAFTLHENLKKAKAADEEARNLNQDLRKVEVEEEEKVDTEVDEEIMF